jgi:hypothetical protein
MSEIVENLRGTADAIGHLPGVHPQRLVFIERAASHIEALEARNKKLEEALSWFLEDERFQVAVGGNPNAVENMLSAARSALRGE